MSVFSTDRMNSFISEASDYFDWLTVLREHGITEWKETATGWQLTCPFHDDRRPSFLINRDMGTYHCFSCGRKGTITRLMYELTETDSGYGAYCEKLLRSTKYLQDKLGFNTLFVDGKSLNPAFLKRRTFSAKSHLAQHMPLTVLQQRVSSSCAAGGDRDRWNAMVFTFSLLQDGTSTDDVWAMYRKELAPSKTQEGGSEEISLASLVIDD